MHHIASLPMIAGAEPPQFLRIEFEEVVRLETPAPVETDRTRRIHAGALIESEEILHGDDRHACA